MLVDFVFKIFHVLVAILQGTLQLLSDLVSLKCLRKQSTLAAFYKDRRCVVTGGASGIGLATVRQLHSLGAQVVAVDLNQVALKALKKELPSVHIYDVNLVKPGASAQVVEFAIRTMGGLDFLHNNAGIVVMGNFLTHSDKQLQFLSDVNLVAPASLTLHALPEMIKQGGRIDICFTASLSSWCYAPAMAFYGATKHGVRGLMHALIREYPAVNFSSVYPSITNTNLAPKKDMQSAPWLLSWEPEDVANCILWGVLEKKQDIFPGFVDKLGMYTDAIFPSLLDFGLARMPAFKTLLDRDYTVGFLSSQKAH